MKKYLVFVLLLSLFALSGCSMNYRASDQQLSYLKDQMSGLSQELSGFKNQVETLTNENMQLKGLNQNSEAVPGNDAISNTKNRYRKLFSNNYALTTISNGTNQIVYRICKAGETYKSPDEINNCRQSASTLLEKQKCNNLCVELLEFSGNVEQYLKSIGKPYFADVIDTKINNKNIKRDTIDDGAGMTTFTFNQSKYGTLIINNGSSCGETEDCFEVNNITNDIVNNIGY